MSLSSFTLVLGGVASGKSAYAERLALSAGGGALYIATACPRKSRDDPDMRARIEAHRLRREREGAGVWTCLEAPLELPSALARGVRLRPSVILVDCLALWLANALEAGRDPDAATAALRASLAGASVPCVVVSAESGLGTVPQQAITRHFRDALGRLNQAMTAQAARVVLVVAGLPVTLKLYEGETRF